MAYTLKLTNGNILLNLPDQTSDSVSTSLTLIGKNVNAYGTDINQNYIRILENFANNRAPTNPLIGQVWFDTVTQQLKVKTTGGFKPVGTPAIATTLPLTLSVGDFWFDSNSQQLKFKASASSDPVVIGPAIDASLGKSGWVLGKYTDTLGSTQTVVQLYSNDALMGILSTATFRIASATTETAMRVIGTGFNANTSDGLNFQFYGTATYATAILDAGGVPTFPEDFIRTNSAITTTNVINVVNDSNPLTVGTDQDFQFKIEKNGLGLHTTATIRINGYNEDFNLKINSAYTVDPVLHIDSTNAVLGIFNSNPSATWVPDPANPLTSVRLCMDVAGNVLIRGDLIVTGSTTNIQVQELLVRDKTIYLSWTNTANQPGADLIASGGGLVLRGEKDHSIKWYLSSPNGSSNVWSITDSVELNDPTAGFKIAGRAVLSYETLESQIKYAPGLTDIGALNSATIGTIKFTKTGAYETTIGSAVSSSTIIIGDTNVTAVNFAGRRLTNIAQPSIADTTSTYQSSVATVKFVQDYVTVARNPKIALTMDVTGHATNPEDPNLDVFVLQMLTYLYDPNEPDVNYATPENAKAKVLVVRYTTPAQLGVPSNYADLNDPVLVDKGGNQNSASVVGWTQFIRVTTDIPATDLGINRCIKQYIVTGGVWTRLIYTGITNTVWKDSTW
jgi:hypothetical protein